MEKRLDNNGYIDFPFPATRNEDGTVNPCGIDLTLETERLEEVAVLRHSANLQRLVEEVNLQDGLFMTLACDWQQQENAVCGFIDIAFRPELPGHSRAETLQLETAFYTYLKEQAQQHGLTADALVNYARAVLDWGWSPLQQRQRRYEKITIQYYCPQSEDAEWCFDHIRHFLVSWYPQYISAPGNAVL